jgi:type IV secretory pathway TrbL component
VTARFLMRVLIEHHSCSIAFYGLGLSLLLAVGSGCSGGGPETHTVTGIITHNGTPVANAQVGFVPASESADYKPAFGQTNDQGEFALKTYLSPGNEANGAMAGKFKVTVQSGYPQDKIVTYEDLAASKGTIPSKYADASTTAFEAEVTESGENKFSFDMLDN